MLLSGVRVGVRDLLVEGAGFGGGAAAGGEGGDAEDADGAVDREGEDVADAQAGMGFLGGLAVDADETLGDEASAVSALAHEAGAPEPFVEALPVAVFLVGNRRAPGGYRKRR